MKNFLLLLLLPLVTVPFIVKNEVSEACHKKLLFCLRNLKRFNCLNPESFTMCTNYKCTHREIKVLSTMICHVNSALVEITALSKGCSSAYRKCRSLTMPPLLLLLDRGETFDAHCHAVTSEEFKDCLSGECSKQEETVMISRSCNPWNPHAALVNSIRPSCYTYIFTCLGNVTSPTCYTIKQAETCLLRYCYKAEIETIDIVVCSAHKTLLLYSKHINEDIPNCSANNCSIKEQYPINLWLSPTELNSRICAGHYPHWDSCIHPPRDECNRAKIHGKIRDFCLPSMSLRVSQACEDHFEKQVADLHSLTCQTVRSTEDMLRKECTENEIHILLTGSCESLRHFVFISKNLMDSAPSCFKRMLSCHVGYKEVDKLYDPKSHSRNFCWSLSFKSLKDCLNKSQNGKLDESACSVSMLDSIISAGCTSSSGALTHTCSRHALACIHGNIKSCKDIRNQESCLLEMCTSIEASFVMRESCTTLDYVAELRTSISNVPLECGQSIYYCLSHLYIPGHEWFPSSKVEKLFCQAINTDLFIRCALEDFRCSTQDVNMFIQTTCMYHFQVVQSITTNCIEQIKLCGNLTLEAACAGLTGVWQCVKQSGHCSLNDVRRIIHQACSTLESVDGFFLVSQTLKLDCAVLMLTCVGEKESLEDFQATTTDFCAHINSSVFRDCVSHCDKTYYSQVQRASCNQTAIIEKVRPMCYARAMICFDSSTCMEADINHNCLGSSCSASENILIRDNFCKTERYLKRLASAFGNHYEHCMSLFLDCALRSQITVGMRFDLKELQDRLCRASAKENARQCYVTGGDCQEGLYEIVSVLACSPVGERVASIEDACIIHIGSCLQLPNVANCAAVAARRTCIRQKCNEVATSHVISRACESMSFVQSVLDILDVSRSLCREKLQQCLQYQDYPITHWLDVQLLRRRLCQTINAETFKKCFLEPCKSAPIKQITFTACDFKARVLGLEQLSACSVLATSFRLVMAAGTLPLLSWGCRPTILGITHQLS